MADMKITGIEANALLFILDKEFSTNSRGKVSDVHTYGLTRAQAQNLRDRLFAAHEHPEDGVR